MPSTAEVCACVLRYLDWREHGRFERSNMLQPVDPRCAQLARACAEAGIEGGFPEWGDTLGNVVWMVREHWPDYPERAVEEALGELEKAGLVRRDTGKIMGGLREAKTWRANIDEKLRELLYRVRAAAPGFIELAAPEMAKLEAHLITRDPPNASLPSLKENARFLGELEAERRWREHLRSVLEHNRKLRSADVPATQALAEQTPVEEKVPDRARKAGEQYRQAAEALGVLAPTDREVYDAVAGADAREGEASDLPSFATWQRNLREYRRLRGQQKNRPRAGRERDARGLVRAGEI